MAEYSEYESDWIRCVEFHGHECPGLAIGFVAAKAGLERIAGFRAEDEEIVAVVETDACGIDAVQVLTGCTSGKGNLIVLDHGKQVFTFFNRDRSAGVRLSMRTGGMPTDERYRELTVESREGRATPEMQSELSARRRTMQRAILEMTPEALFEIGEPAISVPEKARVQRSELCAKCGEPTMPLKMVDVDGRRLCRPCAADRSPT